MQVVREVFLCYNEVIYALLQASLGIFSFWLAIGDPTVLFCGSRCHGTRQLHPDGSHR